MNPWYDLFAVILFFMLTLDSDFDSGSLDVKRLRIEGDTVYLTGQTDAFTNGGWKWLNFKVGNPRGRKLTFTISDAFSEGADRLDGHAMVFSEDGESWTFFAHHEHDTKSKTYTFTHDRAFESDMVQVAYAIPYPVSRLETWLDTLDAEKQVIGHTSEGRALWRLRIGEGERNIVLMSGVHPNESLAGYTLEGTVEYLLSPEAKNFRVRGRVWVYAMVNPDGRFAGLSRSTAQHPNRDSNRVWRPDLWSDMDEIRIIGEAIQRDTGGRLDAFVDFHCSTENAKGRANRGDFRGNFRGGGHFVFMDCSRGYADHVIWQRLKQLEPQIEAVDCGTANPSTETMAILQYDAGFAMTFETLFCAGENIEALHEQGRNVGRAIAALHE